MTFFELVTAGRAQLARAGISSGTAALDADLLARHAVGWDHATWLSRRHEQAPPTFERRFADLIARRTTREPVAYVRGVQEFWGRVFHVTPAVLIPRPETELVVDAALPLIGARPGSRVVDVGTGSGCIAITLALECPSAEVCATDISEDALEVARRNASRLGASRVHFVRGSYLASLAPPIDLIVSNPPYVATTDRDALAPEVRDHEPGVALFAGHDGLHEIRGVLQHARQALTSAGRLVMEIGDGQAEDIAGEIAAVGGLVLLDIREDLQHIPRVAILQRVSDEE